MIKASYVNTLLEAWVTVGQKKVEVLDDLSSWREIASAFKHRIQVMKRQGSALEFRFFYYPKDEKVRVWVAYDAIHQYIAGDLFDNYPDSDNRQRLILSYLYSILQLDWLWTRPYVGVSRYLLLLKKKISRFEK